jgi:hypothetical protein
MNIETKVHVDSDDLFAGIDVSQAGNPGDGVVYHVDSDTRSDEEINGVVGNHTDQIHAQEKVAVRHCIGIELPVTDLRLDEPPER